MKLTLGQGDRKCEQMKRKNREAYVYPPPDDGREWILLPDAAKLLGILPPTLLRHAKKQDWTRTCHKGIKTWLLKKDFDHYLWFVKDRARWYKRRRPENWKPEIAMNSREDEELFKRIFLTTAQAAAYMGISENTIRNWTKKGKISVYLTRKMGVGGKYWYSPTNLRNLKESEQWQEGRRRHEKTKATMRQGIVDREVYTARHRPYIYQGIPPGWITLREVAERLDISINSARHLRRMNRFMSEQFVGEWDTKNRPWFCDEDGVEAYKNNEDYQKFRQRGRNAMRAMISEPPLAAAASSEEETLEKVCHTRQNEITFGCTDEELKMPYLRITGVDEMW